MPWSEYIVDLNVLRFFMLQVNLYGNAFAGSHYNFEPAFIFIFEIQGMDLRKKEGYFSLGRSLHLTLCKWWSVGWLLCRNIWYTVSNYFKQFWLFLLTDNKFCSRIRLLSRNLIVIHRKMKTRIPINAEPLKISLICMSRITLWLQLCLIVIHNVDYLRIRMIIN